MNNNTKKKKNFGEGFVYTSANYIMWFMQGNFYFWLMNIPLILVLLLLFLSQDNDFLLFLTLSALPIGPALTALFSVMGKLVREKDVNVTRDFFRAYRINFFDSIFFWTLELAVLAIIYTDKIYVLTQFNSKTIQIVFMVLLFICASMTFNIFPIISRFYFKKLDMLKLALYYSVKKIYISILSFALIYIMWMLLIKVPGISLLIILLSISILCYAVMYLHKNTMFELEEKLNSKAD